MTIRVLFAAAMIAVGASASAETVTIHTDEYGIPHIYAETAEGGLYASGWAMARDRLVQTLENYMRGMGRFSEADGPGEKGENVRADLQSRMWDHYGESQRRYETLPAPFRSHNAAFVAGINAFMEDHPDEVPAWWTGDVDVYMPVAFSRQFLWGWPVGQAAEDLQAVGLEMEFDIDAPYSNEMALAPSKTTFGAAALIIDPHLGWFGRQRYWEVRIHAGDVNISGFATAGFPYVNLGHNEYVAWAHTTGGPDTADVYELTLNPENAMEYRYDAGFKPLTTRTVELKVKGEASARAFTFYDSHYGPIVARSEGKAYAARLAYADAVGYLASKYYFMIAKDYIDVMKALEICEIMPQNVMVADTKGNIYYQRTGRVPVRPEGVDPAKPIDGATSKNEWRGLHPTKDFVQVLNPPQGYMQNCNISPDVMMVDSPMRAKDYPPYIWNQPSRSTNQRATRATEALHKTKRFTVEAFKELSLDKKVYQAERWGELLASADRGFTGRRSDEYLAGLEGITTWDGVQDKNSRGALKFYYWKSALLDALGKEAYDALTEKVSNYLDLFGVPDSKTEVTEAENAAMVLALEKGMARMKADWGRMDAAFGDVFRAGRLDYDGDDVSWPVGGGSLSGEGMATVRAIGFTAPRADHTRWGEKGQTSTEVVVMTTPIQSWTQPPIGQSDRPDSPYFRDQAEKLLSGSQLKPSWFSKAELEKGHIRETLTLEYAGPSGN